MREIDRDVGRRGISKRADGINVVDAHDLEAPRGLERAGDKRAHPPVADDDRASQ